MKTKMTLKTMENSDSELQGFPRELLDRTVQERMNHFIKHTMAHPHLNKAYQNILDAVYKAPGTSLIFVVGPTGVGKSTLLYRMEQKVIERNLADLEIDRGKIPIFGVESKSPELSQFEWKDFYIRLLEAINEPLIDKKIAYHDKAVNKSNSKSQWRLAVESALKNRRPDAFYIDEAHHLAQLSSGQKLKDQPEVLKSLANLGKVKIIPTGTYDLLQLTDLGDQLCRRTKIVHFPRYRASVEDEREKFKSIVKALEIELPLQQQPDLSGSWEFLYERSLGCVGILKDWLSETLYDVLTKKKPAVTILLRDLERKARPVNQCRVMLSVILAGEKRFVESVEELNELRRDLGLVDLDNGAGKESITRENSKNSGSTSTNSSKQKQPIGQPKAVRYPVGDVENAK
jgi:energy-coupling factor transporter ATP-binding protein EcfA2